MGPETGGRVDRRRGVTLPEMLVVLAIVGLAVLVTVPFAASKLRELAAERAAGEIQTTLRAARSVAVTRSSPVEVTILVDPDNLLSYTDAAGRQRVVRMPAGVRIVSADSPILFRPDGSVPAAASAVVEAEIRGSIRRWTVSVGLVGLPRVQS